MIIYTDDLPKGCEKSIDCSGEILLPKSQSYEQKAKIKVKGKIVNNGGEYIFTGSAEAVVVMYCDSCLAAFDKKLSFQVCEVFTKNKPKDEQWHFKSCIDLSEALAADVLLEMPMKALCSESCKGLCFVCGQNLNEKECGCNRNPIDPRFAEILQHLQP